MRAHCGRGRARSLNFGFLGRHIVPGDDVEPALYAALANDTCAGLLLEGIGDGDATRCGALDGGRWTGDDKGVGGGERDVVEAGNEGRGEGSLCLGTCTVATGGGLGVVEHRGSKRVSSRGRTCPCSSNIFASTRSLAPTRTLARPSSQPPSSSHPHKKRMFSISNQSAQEPLRMPMTSSYHHLPRRPSPDCAPQPCPTIHPGDFAGAREGRLSFPI